MSSIFLSDRLKKNPTGYLDEAKTGFMGNKKPLEKDKLQGPVRGL
jgi:hypothetical protein